MLLLFELDYLDGTVIGSFLDAIRVLIKVCSAAAVYMGLPAAMGAKIAEAARCRGQRSGSSTLGAVHLPRRAQVQSFAPSSTMSANLPTSSVPILSSRKTWRAAVAAWSATIAGAVSKASQASR